MVGLIFVIVMAPTDPTFVKDSSSTNTNIRVEPTLIHRFRRINRLSLGRKNRKRTANEEAIKVAVPEGQKNSNFSLNFSSMVNASTLTSLKNSNSKKFKADANATDENKIIMNGHNHHKISETGRLLGSASSTTGKSSSSNSSCHNTSIASLCNLGNTCFLNSVLYTLRFTPGFLHNLHVSIYFKFFLFPNLYLIIILFCHFFAAFNVRFGNWEFQCSFQQGQETSSKQQQQSYWWHLIDQQWYHGC